MEDIGLTPNWAIAKENLSFTLGCVQKGICKVPSSDRRSLLVASFSHFRRTKGCKIKSALLEIKEPPIK